MGKAIRSITIQGYKSIQALDDFELRSLNLLIGANGAGKSNFIGFFTLLRAMVDQKLQLFITKKGGADAQLFLGPKVTRRIVGKLAFGDNAYEFELQPTVDNLLVFEHEVGKYKTKAIESTIELSKGHLETRLKVQRTDTGLYTSEGVASHVYDSVSSWTVYHFHDTSDSAAVRRKGTARNYEALEPDASNLAAFLRRLREFDAPSYTLIRDTVRSVAPFFDDFKLRIEANMSDEMIQLEWTQHGSDYPFHPSQLSDGTLRFICLAAALLQPRPPATILLDEPELGLHPYALGVLAGLLKQAATRTQVVVSTQSATLLDHFAPEDVIVVDRKADASVFRRLSSDELTEWTGQYSLGELWQKNVFEGGPSYG